MDLLRARGIVWLAAALLCAPAAQTQAPIVRPAEPQQAAATNDPILEAAQRWIGRALILRSFYTAAELDFDATGHIKGSPKTTDWTLAGVDLEKIERTPTGELELEGYRVFISYNQPAHTFDRHPQKTDRLRVRLPAPPDPRALDEALHAIFSQGIDPALQRSMPPYWSHYFLPAQEWPDGLKTATILGINGTLPADLTVPTPEKKIEPEFTPEARQAKISGTITASLVIDPEGNPRRITIRQPLGYGLDAKVAEALARWHFKPGSESGKPAVVQLIVNQPFNYIPGP